MLQRNRRTSPSSSTKYLASGCERERNPPVDTRLLLSIHMLLSMHTQMNSVYPKCYKLSRSTVMIDLYLLL